MFVNHVHVWIILVALFMAGQAMTGKKGGKV
jgi:hypothetical protein